MRVRAFPVRLPSGVRYWTVIDEDLAVVGEVDAFLRQVRFGRDGSELTTRSYAGGVALYLRLGVIGGAIGGLIFGIPFGGTATWLVVRLRRERRATDVGDNSRLKRALRERWLPEDQEQAHGLARLVARRRLQCRRALKINPPFTVLVAVVGIVSGAINHHWVGLVLGVLLIGSAPFLFVRLRNLLRKLDQLAGRLPSVEGPGDAE
jgi:hypothetical protein